MTCCNGTLKHERGSVNTSNQDLHLDVVMLLCFSRQNFIYSEFEDRRLKGNIAYSRYETFSLVSLVSADLGIGFVPEWTQDLPNRGFELKKVREDRFQDRSRCRMKPGRPDRCARRHHRYCPFAGAAGQVGARRFQLAM